MVLVVGVLLALSFFSKEEGIGDYHRKGILTLMVTGILGFCLFLLATAKVWFTHLWKKNSNHDRHKQHSQFHPSVQQEEFRKNRS